MVAAHQLAVGTKLQATDVRIVHWPRESMPAGAIFDPAKVVGSIVKTEMVENEPVVISLLYTGDTSGVLALLVPPDMRAMAVAVDEVSDIAGFVLPHTHVDVLVAIREEGAGAMNTAAARSKIVVENVEVLAVAQTTEHKDKPQVEKVVTLLVTPEQAEKLALASHEGSLRLALRNLNDEKIVNTTGASVPALLASYGGVPAEPARPQVGQVARLAPPPVFHRPAAPAFKIEVMRDGNSRDALSFGADGKAIRPVNAQRPAPPPQPESEAKAEPVPGTAVPAPVAANATPAQLKPARTAIAASAPAAGSAAPAMAFEGPDAKTIQVH